MGAQVVIGNDVSKWGAFESISSTLLHNFLQLCVEFRSARANGAPAARVWIDASWVELLGIPSVSEKYGFTTSQNDKL